MARRLRPAALALVLLAAPGRGSDPAPGPSAGMYQVSTIAALMAGHYDGVAPLGDLLARGDLGLGTVEGLDGELVILDGEGYRVDVEGRAHPVPGATTVPFAQVVRFKPDRSTRLEAAEPLDKDGLLAFLDRWAAPGNRILAFRIDGTFDRVEARSVARQAKPYRPLAEATKSEAHFVFEDLRGTLVGFRLPAFLGGVNVPGYHLHVLSADRTVGGHVLGLRVRSAEVRAARVDGLEIRLPTEGPAATEPLGPAGSDAIRRIER